MPGTEFEKQFNNSCLQIATNAEYYHPVATNHFTLTLHLPSTLINYTDPEQRTFAELMGLGDTTDGVVLSLKIANQTVAEPTLRQESIKYEKGNLAIEFPGRIDAFQSTASFHVFVTRSAYDILYSWKMASGNHITGEIGDPQEYWGTAQLDITTGNKGTLVGTWDWSNVWCSELQGVTFDNASNTPKVATITLKYFAPKYTSGTQY